MLLCLPFWLSFQTSLYMLKCKRKHYLADFSKVLLLFLKHFWSPVEFRKSLRRDYSNSQVLDSCDISGMAFFWSDILPRFFDCQVSLCFFTITQVISSLTCPNVWKKTMWKQFAWDCFRSLVDLHFETKDALPFWHHAGSTWWN